ncbi:MmgE/PrpD family protein [Ramlibacter sp. MAHUQ-53]|uniref:MmgE/PrpD family protein n=1 Tax=unclassified Ramlibacter TaxID=2617605 RepID=UPI00363694D1
MNLEALVARLRSADPQAHPALDAKLRWMLLDTWGCVVAGSQAAPVAALACQLAPPPQPGSLLEGGGAGSPQARALWLAMAACWDEACEGHAGAHGRPGVAALAALLPVAGGLRWGEFRRALLVGYEVGARMGAALRIRRGMHVDGNWPALGAAAAVATAMGLDDAGVATAIRLAACQMPLSLYRPVQTGDTARNTYLGHAAALGQFAALGAASGLTAPQDAVDAYAQVGLGHAAVSLDESPAFHVLDAYFKPYAAVRHVHYGAWAASLLREDLGGRQPVAIALEVYEEATVYCGNRQPRTPLQAQFSLSFGIAAMLRWGRLDPWVYRDPQFHDERLRALEAMVTVSVHPQWTAAQRRGAVLTLTLDDGTVLRREVTAVAGDPAMPLPEADLRGKFLAYCDSGGQAGAAQRWLDRVLGATPATPMAAIGL